MMLTLALAGCATRTAKMTDESVLIGPELTLVMPHPGELNRTFEAVQLVSARYGERTFVFESHLSASPGHFLMVGLDSVGRKAMTITWTDTGISYEAAPWVPEQLRPQNVLADIVILYWPETSVHRSLIGGTLTTGLNTRSVMIGDKEIIHIDYQPTHPGDLWSGRLNYKNLAWGYELDVQSLESGNTP